MKQLSHLYGIWNYLIEVKSRLATARDWEKWVNGYNAITGGTNSNFIFQRLVNIVNNNSSYISK